MNSKKDIKVTFLNKATSNDSERIRIFFKDIFNNDVQIDLRPGEIVYSQINYLTNSLKIYSRKGIIKIEEEEMPIFLNYYVGYKDEEIENNWFLFNLKKSLKTPLEPLVEVVEVVEETISNDIILEKIAEEKNILQEVIEEKTILEKIVEEEKVVLEEINEEKTILEEILPKEVKFTEEEEEDAIIENLLDDEIVIEEAINEDNNNILDKKTPKPKSRSKKGPGRPKKRGPKKGAAKRKKLEE